MRQLQSETIRVTFCQIWLPRACRLHCGPLRTRLLPPPALQAPVCAFPLDPVCIECLFSRPPGLAPYGTKQPACAKMAAYPGPSVVPPSSRMPRVTVPCVFVYYCRTYYKAVRVGGGGECGTCAMRNDESRPVWSSLPDTHYSTGVFRHLETDR